MKKMFVLLVIVALALSAAGNAVAADSPRQFNLPIKVLYNARQVEFPDAKPKMDNNRVLVPVRFVAEKLGAKITYKNQLVTIRKDDKVIELPIGSNAVKVNGEELVLDTKAMAEQGRTYVPLRFVSDALGEKVEWDAVNRFVWIGHKDVPRIEDVIEPVDFAPFKHYYTGPRANDYIRNSNNLNPELFGTEHVTAFVLRETDFPLVISNHIVFRFDRVVIDGKEYIRHTSDDRASLGLALFFLQTGQPLKTRGGIASMTEVLNGGIRAYYNTVVYSADRWIYDIQDPSSLKLKDIEYIGIASDYGSAVIMENFLK